MANDSYTDCKCLLYKRTAFYVFCELSVLVIRIAAPSNTSRSFPKQYLSGAYSRDASFPSFR